MNSELNGYQGTRISGSGHQDIGVSAINGLMYWFPDNLLPDFLIA